MGYRVGFHCFETKEAATDYQMSMVAPTITADGKLMHPVKHGDVWAYQGYPVYLSFGDCDPIKDYQDGMQIGVLLSSPFLIVYAYKSLIAMINSLTRDEADERD